jgi:GT2 family glycosyltransferase
VADDEQQLHGALGDAADAPDVSVVVATYRRGASLLDTIGDVLANVGPRHELIVVDQSPTLAVDVASELDRLAASGHIRYLRVSPPNLPYARNVGVCRARGRVVAFCDDDVRVGPDFLARHLACYVDPTVGAVAGGVRLEGTDRDGCGSPLGAAVGQLLKDGGFTANFHRDIPCDVDFGMGCNMSFRRTALMAIGGFDERYRGNFLREEGDAFARVRRVGYRVRFEPSAKCLHLGAPAGGTRNEALEERLLVGFGNETLFFLNACRRRDLGWFLVRMARMIYGNMRSQFGWRQPGWAVRACGEILRGAASYFWRDPRELSRQSQMSGHRHGGVRAA